MDNPPPGPADHAQDFPRRYQRDLEQHCTIRMEEVGVPEGLMGADDLRARIRWTSFDPEGSEGGTITKSIVVNSGVLNPELLKGAKGGRM
jgi:hypothetical protein